MKVAAAGLLVCLSATSAWAQVYKCVDARGVTHYADKPTAGCANAKVDIRPSPPISGRLSPPVEDTAQQDADFKRRQAERADAQRAEQERRATLQRRCAELRYEQARLSSGRRIAQLNAQGERVFMDDDVRARRLAEVQGNLAQCP